VRQSAGHSFNNDRRRYPSIQVLLTSPTFAAFLFASLILAVTPGPGVIYIVTRTLGQGRKAGRTGGGADDSVVPCLMLILLCHH
jgi:threonine/homoserine/homoserine lactone efflux protein